MIQKMRLWRALEQKSTKHYVYVELELSWAVQFLTEAVLQKKPKIVFLCETLCKQDIVEKVKNILGFEGVITLESQGRSGSIALLWHNKEEVQLLSYIKSYIEFSV